MNGDKLREAEFPQEIELWYVIPAIRKQLVLSLKKKGVKQKDIAYSLGVTEAAVSQYLSSKRASNLRFGKEIMQKIEESAKKLVNKNKKCSDCGLCIMQEIQNICKLMRKKGDLCALHKRKSCKTPKHCRVCLN